MPAIVSLGASKSCFFLRLRLCSLLGDDCSDAELCLLLCLSLRFCLRACFAVDESVVTTSSSVDNSLLLQAAVGGKANGSAASGSA